MQLLDLGICLQDHTMRKFKKHKCLRALSYSAFCNVLHIICACLCHPMICIGTHNIVILIVYISQLIFHTIQLCV